MEVTYTKKPEIFDLTEPQCIHKDWKDVTLMGMASTPDLVKSAKEACPRADQTTDQYKQRVSRFEANVNAAAVYIRDRVTKQIGDELGTSMTVDTILFFGDLAQ
ncbi:hypothetical protein SeLEV6574_g00082 [Synchytrium endobioticum]|uniref:Uncharacterized protein n=1 Tax=Synchytrium endobioticum TaxID=286115 RepID=A0A507DKU8_9FUNG|nr:hypothetical protein SeLEV6574_g00082 [Synchytrium endobioticum]